MAGVYTDSPQWLAFLNANRATIDAQQGESRRQLKLVLAEQFWKLSKDERNALPTSDGAQNPLAEISDPFDFADTTSSVVVKTKGIVVRTDFTDDAAWASVREAIESAERDGWKNLSNDVEEGGDDDESDSGSSEGDGEAGEDEGMEADAETAANTAANAQASSSAGNDTDTRALIFVTDTRFDQISNIGALRLLGDLHVARALNRPLDYVGKAPPPHRLVGRDGLREVYSGPQIWVYDVQSNKDRTLRVVLGAGAMYGTATGDSWRAKADHVWELHINMDAGMVIDFGGRDNWTASERARNLREAEP
ncbi:hypothetical protein AURDEDRAFT_141344 [Auricularia subglabra TFB-10046 SS5]|nr:hypothetical protein AURDEDRAFT_141344 [Auricularia subglabra TFB-10046 SS5]